MSIEDRVVNLEKKVQKLEDAVLSRISAHFKPVPSDNIEAAIVSKIDDIETQDLVIMALKLKPKQSKSEIREMLQDWGAEVGNWFEGGNLNTRMVNKGIVKKEKLVDAKSIVFSLTKKGEVLSQKLIDNLKSSGSSAN